MWADEGSIGAATTVRDVVIAKSKSSSDAKKDKKPSKVLSMLTQPVHPGMSYNPSMDDHQEVLAEALELERKRRRKELVDAVPLQVKVAEVRRELDARMEEEDEARVVLREQQLAEAAARGENVDALITKFAAEDGDEEAIAKISEENTAFRLKKRPEKLTRAQRNKQRRLRIEALKVRLAKKLKKKMYDAGRAHVLVKEIKKELKEQEQRREAKKMMKEQDVEDKKRVLAADGTVRPLALNELTMKAVPLTDDLKGSMRAIRNKGIISQETAESFVADSKMFGKSSKKGRSNDTRYHYHDRIKG